ncbi:MAG: Clp protease ClpP [Peptostreptococcaceae bacterium]|nr:Clp protease ClpP [Peptostreptococcaceae bacterium]
MPKNNLKNFLQIKNSTETTCDLYFYGDIVDSWWGAWDDTDQYPESIKNFLDGAKGKDINIYINSGGGSVFAGMAIYNMLKRHQGYKIVHVDGLAGSIASVIALAGDKVIIPSNAYMMIHKPWSGLYGNSTELREMADTLDKIEEGILNVYKENLAENADIEVIKAMVNAETWLTGDEAAKYFNIQVSDSVDAVACTSDYFNKYNKVPKNLSNKFKKEEMPKNNIEDNTLEKEMLLMELELI